MQVSPTNPRPERKDFEDNEQYADANLAHLTELLESGDFPETFDFLKTSDVWEAGAIPVMAICNRNFLYLGDSITDKRLEEIHTVPQLIGPKASAKSVVAMAKTAAILTTLSNVKPDTSGVTSPWVGSTEPAAKAKWLKTVARWSETLGLFTLASSTWEAAATYLTKGSEERSTAVVHAVTSSFAAALVDPNVAGDLTKIITRAIEQEQVDPVKALLRDHLDEVTDAITDETILVVRTLADAVDAAVAAGLEHYRNKATNLHQIAATRPTFYEAMAVRTSPMPAVPSDQTMQISSLA